MTAEVRVPTLGESVTEATVVNWLKKPGEVVAVDEMLCELETDKVTIEVPASESGLLGEIIASEGSVVDVGALLTTIVSTGDETMKQSPQVLRTNLEPSSELVDDLASTLGRSKTLDSEQVSESNGFQTNGASLDTLKDVLVPTLGESVTEATVSTWYKAVGDAVLEDEILCELETDKVSLEVTAPAAGFLIDIFVPEGATVNEAARLAVISQRSEVISPDNEFKAHNLDCESIQTVVRTGTEHAPSAQKAMIDAGLSEDQIQGTGRDGRIMKEDVAEAVAAIEKQRTSSTVEVGSVTVAVEDVSREERIRMTRLRQTIAKRLKDAQNTAAILTTYNEVDMAEVISFRAQYKDQFETKHGVRLGFMPFFAKACCQALKEIPEVNAEIDGTDIIFKNYVHMGIATGTPQGLVVPVIRDADRMGFADIEKEIADKGRRARDGKLSISEMQGGTFTISNGGVYGSLMSSPILNPPQSGILGMHKIQERPIVVEGEIKIRPMMYLALSYDHRIVDGKGAVTFLVRVKEALEDPRRLLLDL
ncbi:MAG: 2-oxoglutarate dehydrogenase complex dihydrolipoyllysine-residue succinyltransferase [Aestuariivita sp.]|nr:2-oxoglutarate dehydrogenase complex dihydrolipoyllysine-residue succinyltransferase [Aestuariivita sp.]